MDQHPKDRFGFPWSRDKDVSAMAEIINLRQARKQRARAEKEKTAADNRLKHGRTKAERHATEAERNRAARELAGKRLSDSGDDEGPAGA